VSGILYARAGQRERAGIELDAAGRLFGGMAMEFWLDRVEGALQPDLVYLDPTRAHLVSAGGIEGPPTLVIEILSPSTTNIDRSTKHQLYRRFEVPYYWIVDPEARTVEAYGLAEGQYQLFQRASGAPAV